MTCGPCQANVKLATQVSALKSDSVVMLKGKMLWPGSEAWACCEGLCTQAAWVGWNLSGIAPSVWCGLGIIRQLLGSPVFLYVRRLCLAIARLAKRFQEGKTGSTVRDRLKTSVSGQELPSLRDGPVREDARPSAFPTQLLAMLHLL